MASEGGVIPRSLDVAQTEEIELHPILPNSIPFPLPACNISYILGNCNALHLPHSTIVEPPEQECSDETYHHFNNISQLKRAFFKTPKIPKAITIVMPDDLRTQWLYHSVPENLPIKRYTPPQFLSDCEIALQGLFAINSKNCKRICEAKVSYFEEPSPITEKGKDFISLLLNGIRMPDIREMIDDAVNRECENWDTKLNEDTRLLLEKFRAVSKTRSRKFNRFACKIDWAPSFKSNVWSEMNLHWEIRRSKLKSVELVYNYNNTRHVNSLVSRNFAVNPHKRSEAKIYAQKKLDATTGISEALQNVQDKEAIITVDFYHPVRGHKMASVDILGSQTLADLRDSFECSEDCRLSAERFRGSVFFIDGILYADTRDPNALDYSADTGQFFLSKNPGKLRSTRGHPQHLYALNDICIPLHQHCAFLHQGDCEHRVVFSSIRKFNAFYDSIYSLSYPLRIYEPCTKIRFCDVCRKDKCTRLVFNSRIFNKNPTALCGTCAQSSLYDKHGQVIQSDVHVCLYSEIS